MTVRTQLKLCALLPVVLAVLTSGALFYISMESDKAVARLSRANRFMSEVFSISRRTRTFTQTPNTVNANDWLERAAELTPLIASSTTSDRQHAVELQSLEARYLDARDIVLELQKSHTESDGSLNLTNPDAQALIAALRAKTDAMVLTTISLLQSSQIKVFSAHQVTFMVLIILSILMAMLLSILSLLTSRQVARGITALKTGTDALSAGDLEHKINLAGSDELSALANAFDSMTSKLKEYRDVLQVEVSEHRDTSSELRNKNLELSDAMIKLERAQEQAVNQQRHQALRQVSGGIIREINESLTPIVGISQMLIDSKEARQDPEELAANIQAIRESAQRASNVVTQLSDYIMPGKEPELIPVQLDKIVQDAITMTRPRWKDQTLLSDSPVNITAELDSGATVMADANTLTKAVANLILNSVDALPAGGVITIKTAKSGNAATLSIADKGIGMTREHRQRACEPFFSTKGVSASGMGLTIVNNIVSRHHGGLEIESEEDRGTTVTIELPLDHTPVNDGAPISKPDTSVLASKRVLAIDDDEWTVRVLKLALEARGMIIDTADNGERGLQKFSEGSYDIVLTDRAMPDMSGDTVAREIKKSSPDMPVVMLTGFGHIMGEQGDHPEGVDYILGKPFELNALEELLSRILGSQ